MANAPKIATPTNGVDPHAPMYQQQQPPVPIKSCRDWLKTYAGEITRALPAQIGADRFNRICASVLTQNPKIGECTPESFIGAILCAAQLGLEPNTSLGQAYLIPRWNGKKGVNEVNFEIGYKGMMTLARNSKEIAMIKAHEVYANDKFSYSLGLEPTLNHIPARGDRGPVVAYYAFYKTRAGDFDFEVASRQEMEAFGRRHSKSFSSGPWATFFDEMAKKTLIKRVLKYAPLSSEVAGMINTDQQVKNIPLSEHPQEHLDLTLIQGEYPEIDTPAHPDPQLIDIADPNTGEIYEDQKAA